MKKKITIVFLVLSICISIIGCKSNNENTNSKISDAPINFLEEKPPNIDISYIVGGNTKRMDEVDLVSWASELSDICGAKIDLQYIEADDLYKKDIEIDTTRLVYFSNIQQLKNLKEAGLIIPLNEYFYNSQILKQIDERVLDSVSDIDGNIWALPSFVSSDFVIRRYNTEWLGELGLNVPSTCDELEEIGRKIKQIEGGDNNYLFLIQPPSYSAFQEIADIFFTYGCYPNIYGLLNVSYDEYTGKYIDIALTSEFELALTYLRYLIDEDLVLVSHSHDAQEKYSFISGYHGFVGGDYNTGFIGPTSDRTILEILDPQGIAILRNTKDIAKKLDFIVESIFSDREMIISLLYGAKNHAYIEYEDYLLRKTNSEGDLYNITPIKVNILNPLENVIDKNVHLENLSEYENIDLNERAKEMIKKMNDFRDDISGKVYEYNLFQQVDFNMKTLYGENNYEEDIETTIYT